MQGIKLAFLKEAEYRNTDAGKQRGCWSCPVTETALKRGLG